MKTIKDYTNQTFGELTAIRFVRVEKGNAIWIFRCNKCNPTHEIERIAANIVGGNTKTCGHWRPRRGTFKSREEGLMWRIFTRRAPNGSSYNDGNLLFEDFCLKIKENCVYCGRPPANIYRREKTRRGKVILNRTYIIYQRLDRVNNNRAHDKDNIVPCCSHCNFAKADWTVEEFQDWIRQANKKLPENIEYNDESIIEYRCFEKESSKIK